MTNIIDICRAANSPLPWEMNELELNEILAKAEAALQKKLEESND